MFVRACICACVRACVCVCVRACVRACVCQRINIYTYTEEKELIQNNNLLMNDSMLFSVLKMYVLSMQTVPHIAVSLLFATDLSLRLTRDQQTLFSSVT